MQQQDGFLAKRRTNPTTIGIVAAAHVAVLGALILAPPDYVRLPIVFKPLHITDVKDPVPPPPQPQPIQHVARLVTPTPIVPTTTPPDTTLTLLPPIAITPPQGLQPFVPTQPLKAAPEPVTVAPQYDQRYADQLQPSYPPAMAHAEIEGTVTVRVLVGTDGRVKQVETIAATDPAFAEATQVQALRHWRFKPSTRDGAPAEGWVTMRLRFVLSNN